MASNKGRARARWRGGDARGAITGNATTCARPVLPRLYYKRAGLLALELAPLQRTMAMLGAAARNQGGHPPSSCRDVG
jgi:hypothetical protein